ncbi:MAG: deubiquitinating enzyme [Piccolia ochrophora]|nr:MAG: deubiquitinating enzyme [Piccolia ochrophora]
MAAIPVVVKHSGKRYNVDLDPGSTGEDFKLQLYSLTNVEPERQKILVKGGQLKDDTALSSLGVKAGHTFMMMGTPLSGDGSTSILQPPKEKMRFLEDLSEAEAARVEGATPAGLQNLGNTCYLNSTLQTLRAVPELQTALATYQPAKTGGNSDAVPGSSSLGDLSQFGLGGLGASTDLTASLRDLYQQMSDTQDGFPPLMFLNALRTSFPQFAQKSKTGHGYAQQDAEEAWSQIVSQLRQKLKVTESAGQGANGGASTPSNAAATSFVDKYLAGKFQAVLKCDEVAAAEAGEEAIQSEDTFYKLDCHISAQVNHLRDGIMAGLEEKIEKRSPILERDATYTKSSRIARLPKYLTVHFVRFFWKREAQKKAKIMRKVSFPKELDIVEFCTEELKSMLIPVRDKIRDVRKDEHDVERARKRQKRVADQTEKDDKERKNKTKGPDSEEKLAEDKKVATSDKTKANSKGGAGDTEMADEASRTDADIEAEKSASILAAKKELANLMDPKLVADEGANQCGLYELRGVVTHQGASADSGHYTSYVKKEGLKDPKTGNKGEEDGKWWWFNDDKVSEVEAEKIETLSGGGESHSALILLYRAIPVPIAAEP